MDIIISQVFTSVALFNMLISPLNAFPWVLNGLVESWVSLKRVQKFLEMDELDFRRYYIPGRLFRTVIGQTMNRENGSELISIIDGCFTWRRQDGDSVDGTVPDIESDIGGESVVEWLLDGVNITIRKVSNDY